MKAIAARKGQIPKYSFLKNELRKVKNICLHLQICPIDFDQGNLLILKDLLKFYYTRNQALRAWF